jgi:hypothetical protein
MITSKRYSYSLSVLGPEFTSLASLTSARGRELLRLLLAQQPTQLVDYAARIALSQPFR